MDVGQTLHGKYRLLRLLGDGGMGSVYEAEHERLGTRVAIKILHADLARRTGIRERFLQEARVSAQIRSPHVVRVLDVDTTPEGVAYLVMELLEGEPISRMLEREKRVPAPRACEYTHQILEALEAAHALGIIHRDLKPENVFITMAAGKPVLKLIDFGIAKLKREGGQGGNLTMAGIMMGTAEYCAPEQAFSADKVDVRSDVYAVGVMLYEMLSGSRPVNGDDARVIALKVERGEVRPIVHLVPDLPRDLAGLVHRAMAFRPDLRFASAAEMRLKLEEAMGGQKRSGTVAIAEATPAPPPREQVGLVTTERALPAFPARVGGTEWQPADPRAMTPQTPPVVPFTPMPPNPSFTPMPPNPSRPARRKAANGWLTAALVFALLLGVGAGIAYIVHLDGHDETTPTPFATTPPTQTPSVAQPTASQTPPSTTTGIPPLATPTVPQPTNASTSKPPPRNPADATAPKPEPEPLPTIPPLQLPFLDGGVFTLPSGFPSTFPPIPLPFPSPPPPGP